MPARTHPHKSQSLELGLRHNLNRENLENKSQKECDEKKTMDPGETNPGRLWKVIHTFW